MIRAQVAEKAALEDPHFVPTQYGCHGDPLPFKTLTYLDRNDSLVLPIYHALYLGTVKDILGVFFQGDLRDPRLADYTLSRTARRAVKVRGPIGSTLYRMQNGMHQHA